MKRLLALPLLAVAAVTAAPASASHLCVTSNGRDVVCAPHVALDRDEICVTSAGRPVVCV